MSKLENIDLPKALKLIKTLQSQLEEVNMVSKEYESEMENVIDRLQLEVSHLNRERKNDRLLKRNLEIKMEEMESENSYLSQKLLNITSQNDKLMENNILLEHEVNDLRKRVDYDCLKSLASDKSSPSSLCSTSSMAVSTSGSSLLIKPIISNSKDTNQTGVIPTIQVSHSTVMTTTSSLSFST